MAARRFLVLAALAVPAPAAAQVSAHLTPYVAAGHGARGELLLFGAGLSTLSGPVGLRLGAALDARATPVGEWIDRGGDGAAPRTWGADLDALLFLAARPATAAIAPYAIGTLGVRTSQRETGSDPRVHVGYGGGLRLRLSDFMALELESRQYREFDSRAGGGWSAGGEYRAGLSLRLGAVPARAPSPPRTGRSPRAAPAAAGVVARRTIETGEAYIGTRYRWGGSRPGEGFDCSGFVQYVYRRNGIELPRVSSDQARAGLRLPADLAALEPGDLMFFASDGAVVDHVAIYTGNGRILHSSASGGGVRYDDLGTRRGDWYARHFVAARRVIDSGWFGAAGAVDRPVSLY